MIGVRYIQAVKTMGYISLRSGKITTNDESNKPNPSVKQAKIKIDSGNIVMEVLKGTFKKSMIRKSGTKEKNKLMIPDPIDETTKEVLGR